MRAGSVMPAEMETTFAKNIANYFDHNAVSEGDERARVRLGLKSATVPVGAWASVHRMEAFLAFQKPSLCDAPPKSQSHVSSNTAASPFRFFSIALMHAIPNQER